MATEMKQEPIIKFREWFEADYKSSQAWRLEAKKDYGFTEGYGQVTPEQRAKIVKREKREPLIFKLEEGKYMIDVMESFKRLRSKFEKKK